MNSKLKQLLRDFSGETFLAKCVVVNEGRVSRGRTGASGTPATKEYTFVAIPGIAKPQYVNIMRFHNEDKKPWVDGRFKPYFKRDDIVFVEVHILNQVEYAGKLSLDVRYGKAPHWGWSKLEKWDDLLGLLDDLTQ